jgi:hypothetical protein
LGFNALYSFSFFEAGGEAWKNLAGMDFFSAYSKIKQLRTCCQGQKEKK